MTQSRRLRRVLALMLVVLGGAVVPAVAQQDEARRFSVGAAAGLALPMHGDYDFNAAAWQADARFDVSRHVAVAVFFEEWRHTTEEVLTNQRLIGPNGPLGHIARVTLRTEYVTRAVGFNLLFKAPVGRVTWNGGGGVGSLFFVRDYSQTLTGCESSVAGSCSDYSNRFDNTGFSAQVQGGADVALTTWMALTGEFRVLVPVDDPGSGHMSLTAGIRFRL